MGQTKKMLEEYNIFLHSKGYISYKNYGNIRVDNVIEEFEKTTVNIA